MEAQCIFSLISKKDYFEKRDALVCINDGFKDFSAELYNYFLFCTQTKYSFVLLGILSCFWGSVSCGPGSPQTNRIAKDSFELLFLVSAGITTLCRFYVILDMELRALCVLGNYSPNWTTAQHLSTSWYMLHMANGISHTITLRKIILPSLLILFPKLSRWDDICCFLPFPRVHLPFPRVHLPFPHVHLPFPHRPVCLVWRDLLLSVEAAV